MPNKYLTFFYMHWQNGLAYPFSFGMWRFRQLLSTVMSLTIWSVIFAQNGQVFGYSRDQMISYIFIVSLLQGAILATDLHSLSGKLYSGEMSQLFIKPVRLFRYFASQEIADKLKNLIFIFLESALLYFIFKPELVIPTGPILALFASWVLLGIVIHFFIEILFGTIGFWSPDTWGPKFLFFMIVDATAGKLFPLDIFPEIVQRLLFLTPFPYLSYAQSQLFLGRLPADAWVGQTLGLIGWSAILALITHIIWRSGMRHYSAAGQ